MKDLCRVKKDDSASGGPFSSMRFFRARFSSLPILCVLAFNSAVFLILSVVFVFINRSDTRCLESYAQDLLVRGKSIAALISTSSSIDGAGVALDNGGIRDFVTRHASVDRRLRLRVYDGDAVLIMDSRSLSPSVQDMGIVPLFSTHVSSISWFRDFMSWIIGDSWPPYVESESGSGKTYRDVRNALNGSGSTGIYRSDDGKALVLAAAPIEKFGATSSDAVSGVLLLSRRSDDVSSALHHVRLVGMWAFILAGLLIFLISIFFTRLLYNMFVRPVSCLADVAESMISSVREPRDFPDLTGRGDDVGRLSGALQSVSKMLHDQFDESERLAADLAHELKNPLTSLRGVVELLSRDGADIDRCRCVRIARRDIYRMNRLIDDFSDTIRLDEELARDSSESVDMIDLLRTLCPIAEDADVTRRLRVELVVDNEPRDNEPRDVAAPFVVRGRSTMLARAISNLLDNACSFSPQDGVVRVGVRSVSDDMEICVEDQGPGIPKDNLERIFERFCTERPEDDSSGRHSGLGLNIARRIVEWHGGRLWAENRIDSNERAKMGISTIIGARFIVRLPLLKQ